MTLRTRRALILELGTLAAGLASGCGAADEQDAPVVAPVALFLHGVASGDPLKDGVIIWTRVTPSDADETSVEVAWEISPRADFSELVASGNETATDERDFTVKVDVSGLEPATTYFYRFSVAGAGSAIGRTRTAPAGTASALRFGVVSCSSYENGYFVAYRELARRKDLDLVVHLGDYIYEYGSDSFGDVRSLEPKHELSTLEDYRKRYAHYRLDSDLQALHGELPMAAVWDDHEVANDAFRDGAQNHDASEGSWEERKDAAIQAYFEWMPIRESEGGRQVQRSLSFGSLADLILIDSRLWGRDAPIENSGDEALADPARSILGADQESWLEGQLSGSSARWKLIANQVMMMQIPQLYNGDAWDGYPAARARLLSKIVDEKIRNVVVLTGDIHMSWASDLALDPYDADMYDPETGQGAAAVELTVPGVTSPGLSAETAATVEPQVLALPHVRYAELKSRGFAVVTLTPERLQADYYHFRRVDRTDEAARFSRAVRVERDVSHWELASEPSAEGESLDSRSNAT